MIQFKDLVVGQRLEIVQINRLFEMLSHPGAVYEITGISRESLTSNINVTFEHRSGLDGYAEKGLPPFNSYDENMRTIYFRPENDSWLPYLSVCPLLTSGQTYTVPASCFNGRMFFETGERYTFYFHSDSDSFPGQFRPIVDGVEQSGFGCASEHLPSFAKVFGLGGGALLSEPTNTTTLVYARNVQDRFSSPPPPPSSLAPVAPMPSEPTPGLCGLVEGQSYVVVHSGGCDGSGTMRSYLAGERWRFCADGSGHWKTLMESFADPYGDSGLTVEHLPLLAHIFGLDALAPTPAPVPAPVSFDLPNLHGFVVGETYTAVEEFDPDRSDSCGIMRFFSPGERWRFERERWEGATDEEGPWRVSLLDSDGEMSSYVSPGITRAQLPRLARIFGLTAPAPAPAPAPANPHDLLIPGQTYAVVNAGDRDGVAFIVGEQWRFSLDDRNEAADAQDGPWKVNFLCDGVVSACTSRNIEREELPFLVRIFGLAPSSIAPVAVTVVQPTVTLYELRSHRGARPRRFASVPAYHTNEYEIDPAQDPHALPY